MNFDAVAVKNEVVRWIKKWFEKNAPDCNAVIGISGGKDSSVVAALCAEALGKERVTGVLMPNGEQPDIHVSKALVKHLGIKNFEINIKDAYNGLLKEVAAHTEISPRTKLNLAPRLRMSALYAVAQSVNGIVVNTSNLSEAWIGYCTKYGDNTGDLAPLLNFTVTEVKALGHALGLPAEFVEKAPSDGLCGKTDEENIGFSYQILDKYLRTKVCEDKGIKKKIDVLHRKNKFKARPMSRFK